MAGEDVYIHPIIQAIMQGQQMALQRNQLAADIAQRQTENTNRQALLKIEQQRADQAEKQLENEHDFHSKTLEQQNNIQQAQMELYKMQAIKGIRDSIYEGMSPDALMNSGSAPQPNASGGSTPDTRAFDLPGLGIHIPYAQMPTQESLGAGAARTAGQLAQAQSAGIAAGRQPYDEAMAEIQFGHQKSLQQGQQDFESRLNATKQDWEGIQKGLDRQSQASLANIRGNYELAGKKMEYDLSPDEMSAGVMGLMSGEFQPNFKNPRDAKLATAFQAIGGRPVPPADNAAARQMGSLDDIFNKMEDLKSMLPDENKLGINSAKGDAYTMGKLNALGIPTDYKEAMAELAPQMLSLVKDTQGVTGNRGINPIEAQKASDLLTNARTQQQMDRAIQSIKDTRDNRVANVLQAGMNTTQQNVFAKTNQVAPKWLIDQQNIDRQNPQGNWSKGYRPDVQKSLQTGQIMWTDPNAPIQGQ
jgi:hypothetical protein